MKGRGGEGRGGEGWDEPVVVVEIMISADRRCALNVRH